MTEQAYIDAINKIENGNPDEPLLSVLRTGLSPVNKMYLKHALKRVPAPTPVIEEAPKNIDPILREMWAERGRLFRKMAVQSNRFHDCQNDAERKANSVEIMHIWGDIQRVKARIEHFEEHGHLPADEEKFELPDDAVSILRKLNSIRAMISQYQSQIKKLAQLPKDHPEKNTKIAAAERKLADLKLYRGYAKTKLEGEDIH